MNKQLLSRIVGLALLATLCWNCSNFFAEGGTSDTENAVALSGTVQTPSGKPAAGRILSMRRSDYLSPIPAIGDTGSHADKANFLTDSKGRFRIDSVDTGTYTLEAREGDSLATLFDVSVTDISAKQALGSKKMALTSRVFGTVTYRPETFRVFVQVYGLERLVPVDIPTGRFSLRLPPGHFTLRFVDPEMAEAFVKTRVVNISAGQDVDLQGISLRSPVDSYFDWRRSVGVNINTTESGASLKSDLLAFPLLVHLDSSNFNFLQAQANGADIRFSKPDGKTPLPFEIERWDASAKKADLWVRMDTIKANSRDQGLIMYWGNGNAKDSSTAGAVFDTASGYAGVYHLGEKGSILPRGFRDASGHGNHGTGIAMEDASAQDGMIGKGQYFNGKTQYIDVPHDSSLNMGIGDFTMSAWVRSDSLGMNRQIACKRSQVPADLEMQIDYTGKIAVYPSIDSQSVEGFRGANKVSLSVWHHISFTRKGDLHSIYLDGVLDSAQMIEEHNVDNKSPLRIGMDATGVNEWWKGMIDEVRLSRGAESADWIRLSYLNQRQGNAILEWKRLP